MPDPLLDDDDFNPEMQPRSKLGVALLVIALQVLLGLGLIQAFAPSFASQAVETVLSTFSVTVYTPPPPPPPPPPRQEPEKAGKSGNEGKKAVAKATTAKAVIPNKEVPTPVATNTGSANSSGAVKQGTGTGAGGPGNGAGSGTGGNGAGGGAASKPTVRSGEINNARDFPVPAGGRQSRFGKRVIVHFVVTTDGRARNCTVASSGVDAETTARVCPLVVQRIRFNPARRADGTPVEATWGYKVDFFAQ